MSNRAVLSAISYALPQQVLSNQQLSEIFPEWSAEKIFDKTGIAERHIAAVGETASDLAVTAAMQLFSEKQINPEQIDLLIFCTQTPDYLLPTTACLIHQRLGLRQACGAFDINLGCSGYVYALSVAQAMIDSGAVNTVLLLTGDTYSHYIHPGDRSVRPIFGDGAAASLITANALAGQGLGPFVLGTNGGGADNLIIRHSGARHAVPGQQAGQLSDACLYMNGPEILNFTLSAVPKLVHDLLDKAGRNLDEIDYFVFHQANEFILNALRKKIKIPESKFIIEMDTVGNTVSSSIPIALARAAAKQRIASGDLLMLVGFGVGYSWAAGLMNAP